MSLSLARLAAPSRGARASSPKRAAAPLLLAVLALALGACEKGEIPPHVNQAELEAERQAQDPKRLLSGGERVFYDDFQRAELGDKWVQDRIATEAEPPSWAIEGGWVRTGKTKNQGVFANAIPTSGDVRIEVSMASDKPLSGAFAGDLKIEAFNTEPKHEKGYSFINGGWSNRFDTIAKLGEHTADDKRKPAREVEEGKVYRYAVVLAGSQIHWFRDGELLYTFEDRAPVRGPWLGLNAWLSNARFDEVAVYKL